MLSHVLPALLVVVALITLAGPARAQSGPLIHDEVRRDEIRHQLLAGHVGAYVRGRNFGEAYGYAYGVFGVGLGTIGALNWQEDRPLAITWVTGGSISTVAFTTSLFLSRDARIPILHRLVLFNAGVAALGLALSDDPGNLPRLTSGAYAGAAFADVILHGINDLSQRTPPSTLRRHRVRLESGVPLSSAELAQIERDFIATEPVISKRLTTVPMCAGAAVAFAPAVSEDSSRGEKNWSLVGGGLLGLICVLGMSIPDLVDSYEDNLEASKVTITVGPASLETAYRF